MRLPHHILHLQEFLRGHSDATNKLRPWHSNPLHRGKQYEPSALSQDYLLGYAEGYATIINKKISGYCFALGYSHALAHQSPALGHDNYLEGYALGIADRRQMTVLTELITIDRPLTLESYLAFQRPILLLTLKKDTNTLDDDVSTLLTH